MIDELISALVGNELANRISGRFPPHRTSEFEHLASDELRRRNRFPLYALYTIGLGTLATLFWACAYKRYFGQNPWQVGLLFGFPFTLTYLLVLLLGLIKGPRRARELIRFFEIDQRTNIRLLFWVMVAPLAMLGFVSAVALAIG
jgi:hypothetical protein